jgi:histidine ammonia-lyase
VAGSRLVDSAGAVQDAYSLRCAPAVHGASRDAAAYARAVAEREVDAATDNPLFFPGDDGALHVDEPWDFAFEANWRRWQRGEGEGAAAGRAYSGREKASYSAGNFHGQPLALAADALTLALAELADISERRTQLLLDRHHNRNLPANLIPRRGVSSGLMLAQYCAASIVSENKVLAHPASVDSIPTSANSEDHNSMATGAAKKLRQVLANAQAVLAVELLTVAQALEWRVGMERSPLGAPPPEGDPQRDQAEAERFRAATAAERRDEIAAELGTGSAAAYLAVRAAAAAVTEDRPLAGDLLALRRLLEDGTLVAAVERVLGEPLLGLAALRWE